MNKAIDLYFIEQGQGVPLILLHGYPLDHRIWQPVFPLLNENIHIIAPDLRGHGGSPVPEGVYSMESIVDDLIRILDRLRIEKAIIAGHSMGGYVTFKFWQLFPDRISGMALVTTRATADTKERRLDRLKIAEEVLKNGTAQVSSSMFPKLTRNTALYPELKEIMEGVSSQGISGILRGIADRENALPWLASINIPAVVIAGKEDQLIPLEESTAMAQSIPNCELEVIEHTGHLPMMEDPFRVANCINKFVLRIDFGK